MDIYLLYVKINQLKHRINKQNEGEDCKIYSPPIYFKYDGTKLQLPSYSQQY